MQNLRIPKIFLISAFFGILSCDDKDEKPSLRTKIDYSILTDDTPYTGIFVDASGSNTVDVSEGTDRLKMFQALNYQSTSSVSAGNPIDATVLENMFSNTGAPFVDIETSSISISGSALNSSTVKLRDVVASSLAPADAEVVREKIETYFAAIELASQSLGTTASPGQAGKLGNYLVDSRGLEIAQLIQKSLIGALQLDYIGNVLLDEGLDADNFQLVGDHNYTQLEHNWDVAYGLLTLNAIYLEDATDASRNTVEFGAGSYLWEYNKAAYAEIYPAFLKGRAAIVNNDRDQYKALATFIRRELEKAIANAALGYLGKWKTAADDAGRAHAIGEGAGFIYSLRFAQLHEGSATYSDTILENLLGSGGGFWDLTNEKINAAVAAIEAKFKD
jgi:hypothetical protein